MEQKGDLSTIGVRVGLRARGCNGMSYTMDYTDAVKKFDEVFATSVCSDVCVVPPLTCFFFSFEGVMFLLVTHCRSPWLFCGRGGRYAGGCEGHRGLEGSYVLDRHRDGLRVK